MLPPAASRGGAGRVLFMYSRSPAVVIGVVDVDVLSVRREPRVTRRLNADRLNVARVVIKLQLQRMRAARDHLPFPMRPFPKLNDSVAAVEDATAYTGTWGPASVFCSATRAAPRTSPGSRCPS